MPQGQDNIRHVYPKPGTMCVILVNPLLQLHIETLRRRYAEAYWTLDARIDPYHQTVIIVTHDGSLSESELQAQSSKLCKKVRDKPPAEVESRSAGSYANRSIGPLPNPRRWTDMPDTRLVQPSGRRASDDTVGQTVLNMDDVQQPALGDLILTVLRDGHAVDVTINGITFHMHPK